MIVQQQLNPIEYDVYLRLHVTLLSAFGWWRFLLLVTFREVVMQLDQSRISFGTCTVQKHWPAIVSFQKQVKRNDPSVANA